MAPWQPFVLSLLAALVAAAAWADWRSLRIPNRLVLPGAVLGVFLHGTLPGQEGWLYALGGIAVGIGVLLPMHFMRALGAGDVKLMGMVGAFVGPAGALQVMVWTLLAGGVLALGFALHKGVLRELFQNVRLMLTGSVVTLAGGGRARIDAPPVSVGRLPYGLAIAAGTLLHLALARAGVAMF